MRDVELTALLRRATDDLPEPDVAEPTWARGRRARRRRHRAGAVGALVTAAVVGLAVAQGSGGGLLHPSGTTADPAGASDQLVLEPPGPPDVPLPFPEHLGWPPLDTVQPPVDPSATYGDASATWSLLWSSCLQARGYDVQVPVSRGAGTALSVNLDGADPGDYTRDMLSCRAELLTDSPVLLEPGADLQIEDRSALTGRYIEYYWASRCLSDAGVPTDPLVPAETFIGQLAWAQIPAWHPYTLAAEEGRYAEARDTCPIR